MPLLLLCLLLFCFINLLAFWAKKRLRRCDEDEKEDVFLTLIAIAALFGVACFVQTEMDSYIRRIVNLCLVYAIIRLIHESDEWVCWSGFRWGRLVLWL